MYDVVGGGFGAELEGLEEALAGLGQGIGVEMIVGAGEAVDVLQRVFAELASIAILHGVVVGGFGAHGGSSAVEIDNGLRGDGQREEKADE